MISGYSNRYPDVNRRYWTFARTDGTPKGILATHRSASPTGADDVLRRSFLRYAAALSGAGLLDPDRAAAAMADGRARGGPMLQDVVALTDLYVEQLTSIPDDSLAVILRGHLAILERLARLVMPHLALQVHAQADRSALAL